ncbi:hypothetical protein D9756_007173 [Leucocoprinus leucothites]|uniref:Uncharacterized protein n=1 Tax=Leucocoprinus leucothites TaxID=201217 RepID=A0A8H5D5G7_9AGAR|nr:hypothetical protein D9756_007173 [Leucoagaricus leucothites]
MLCHWTPDPHRPDGLGRKRTRSTSIFTVILGNPKLTYRTNSIEFVLAPSPSYRVLHTHPWFATRPNGYQHTYPLLEQRPNGTGFFFKTICKATV